MNRLRIAFLKNCNLKTQKTAFSNRKQVCVFLKMQNFKGQIEILPNA
jgi:hypothetical protein